MEWSRTATVRRASGWAAGSASSGARTSKSGGRSSTAMRCATLIEHDLVDELRQADHGDQGGDAPVALQEEGGDGERPLERRVAAHRSPGQPAKPWPVLP